MSRRLFIALSAAGLAGLLVTFALAVFVHGYGRRVLAVLTYLRRGASSEAPAP